MAVCYMVRCSFVLGFIGLVGIVAKAKGGRMLDGGYAHEAKAQNLPSLRSALLAGCVPRVLRGSLAG